MDGKKEQSGGSVPSEAGTRRCRPHDRRHGCSPTRYHDPVPDSSPSTAGRIIKIALGLGIGAFFFYLVARGLDWADVRDVLRTSEPLLANLWNNDQIKIGGARFDLDSGRVVFI